MNQQSTILVSIPERARAELERIVARFESDCVSSPRWPEVEDYLDGMDGSWRQALLVELIHADLELRLRFGRAAQISDYLQRFPLLAKNHLIVAQIRERAKELNAFRNITEVPGLAKQLDRFELGEVLGQGATAVVHGAFDSRLRREVALKRLRGELLGSEGAIERCLREALHVAQLRHPGIVRLFEAGRTEGSCFLVMELIEGTTLARLTETQRLAHRRAVEIVFQVALALEHAHAQGIVHRDIKPSNILLDCQDRAYLTDFGLARSERGETTLTADGQILGTPAYMSPEQARGDARVDARTDIYSLGAVLYELMSGTIPFRGSPRMVFAQILEEDPRPPRRLDDTIPRDLETVCLKAMAKESGNRYASSADLAADLRRWLDGQAVMARPLSLPARLWRKCRRRPALTGLGVSLVVATMGLCWQSWQTWVHLAEAKHQSQRFRTAMLSSGKIAQTLTLLVPSAPDHDAAHMAQAIERLREHISLIEDDLSCRNVLARDYVVLRSLYDRSGQLDQALDAQRKAVSAHESHRQQSETDVIRLAETASAYVILAKLLGRANRTVEARASSERVRFLDERARELWQHGGKTLLLSGRSMAYWFVSLARMAERAFVKGRHDEAIGFTREASQVMALWNQHDPDEEFFAHHLLRSCLTLGQRLIDQGDVAVASELLNHASKQGTRTLRHVRGTSQERGDLAKCLILLADAQRSTGQDELSLGSLALAQDNFDWLARMQVPGATASRIRCLVRIGQLADRLNRTDEALRSFDLAAQAYEELRHAPKADAKKAAQGVAMCRHVIGRILMDLGRNEEAATSLRAAMEVRQMIARSYTPTDQDRRDIAGTRERLVEVERRLNHRQADPVPGSQLPARSDPAADRL